MCGYSLAAEGIPDLYLSRMVIAPALRHSRAHDVRHLIRRWKQVAQRAGLKIDSFARSGGYDIFFLASYQIFTRRPSLYLSAGIHGDEAAATEALLGWAEKNICLLQTFNVLIFPCLNPWGLARNCRLDADGHDLNRGYRQGNVPQLAAQMRLISGQHFDLALTLHEDYDARGLYIYEILTRKPYWAEPLLEAAALHLPRDPRKKIDDHLLTSPGIVRRTIAPDTLPDWPEAFVLHFQNVGRVFTIETPSEFHIDHRVAAQIALITRAVALCRKEFAQNNKTAAG